MTWGEANKEKILNYLHQDEMFGLRKENDHIMSCRTGCNKCAFYNGNDGVSCTTKMMEKMLEEVQ